jgi:hypothetical protein
MILECAYNLFHEGRKYTGNHRSYILENARSVAGSAATREKIKLREALGYYGHGRRILAKKMDLTEVEAVKLPDGGTAIISNVPSNVTTAFSVADDGTVTHSQEVLDSETGRIVSGLHKSRVGGFSWACGGSDGGRTGATRLTGFSGFDYVLNPGFAHNRGYVLESADGGGVSPDQVLESVAAAVGDDDRAEKMLRGWQADAHFKAMELEDQLEQAALYESALLDKLTGKERDLADLDKQVQAAVQAQEQEKARVKGMVDFIVEACPFFIPEDVQHAMFEADFDRARQIFESARTVDMTQYPVPGTLQRRMLAEKASATADAPPAWDL